MSNSVDTPWTAALQAPLSFTISQILLKFTSIESMMLSNHLILCHPLFLLPSIFPSIRVFLTKLVLRIRWSKYWSFSFSISPSNEYSGLIFFRIYWFDFLAVYGKESTKSGYVDVYNWLIFLYTWNQSTVLHILKREKVKITLWGPWVFSFCHCKGDSFPLRGKKLSAA